MASARNRQPVLRSSERRREVRRRRMGEHLAAAKSSDQSTTASFPEAARIPVAIESQRDTIIQDKTRAEETLDRD